MVYSIRFVKFRSILLLLKISSKKVIIGSGAVIKSFGSIRTIDGGQIIIGNNSCIDYGAEIYAKKGRITIGDNVYIGKGTYVVARESVSIGNDCQIAAYCIIRDSNHGTAKGILIRKQVDDIDKVSIGQDVWIGSHVSVIAGTKINDGAIIGTHSVVNKEIEENAIAVGIPAKIIKYRS